MIKKIINYYKIRQEMVSAFIKHSKYMVTGKYSFDNTLTYIYLKNYKTSEKAKNIFKNNFSNLKFNSPSVKRIINFMLNIKLSNDLVVKDYSDPNCNIQEYEGTVYLPSINEKDCKIFDFKNNTVLVISWDENNYKNKIHNYNYFNKYFLIPKIIKHEDNKQVIIEELINFKTNTIWEKEDSEYVIKDMFNRYIEYFVECKKSNKYSMESPLRFVDDIPKENLISSFINENISNEITKLKFPFVKLHGDLWASNILIDNKDNKNIYYIDWERSKKFIFFYDFFSLMWNDAYVKQDYTYAYEYISGKFDDYFIRIFRLFDINFVEKYRIEYLSIFFLNYIYEWRSNPDDLNNRYLFESYQKLLDEITEYVK